MFIVCYFWLLNNDRWNSHTNPRTTLLALALPDVLSRDSSEITGHFSLLEEVRKALSSPDPRSFCGWHWPNRSRSAMLKRGASNRTVTRSLWCRIHYVVKVTLHYLLLHRFEIRSVLELLRTALLCCPLARLLVGIKQAQLCRKWLFTLFYKYLQRYYSQLSMRQTSRKSRHLSMVPSFLQCCTLTFCKADISPRRTLMSVQFQWCPSRRDWLIVLIFPIDDHFP